MAIVINKLATPTITAQAVAGGTLLADTTYYVFCLFSRTSAYREGDAMSQLTNEVSVLTTSVNRSIQINYSWTVNIIEFADAGGGEVYVTCDDLHCMLAGDSIDISGTTNYNGTYTINFDNSSIAIDGPNRFRINATWVSNDATGTAVCDDDVIGINNNFSLHCLANNPSWNGSEWDKARVSSNQWIGPGYSAPAAVQGYTITSPPTGRGSYAGTVIPLWRTDGMPKGITNWDRPFFQVTSNASWADLTAAMTTWLPNNTNHGNFGLWTQTETLYFLGELNFSNLDILQTYQTKDVTIDGNLNSNNAITSQTYLRWKYCLYKHIGVRRPQIAGNFIKCMIRDECQDSPYYNKALFEDCSFLPFTSMTFYGSSSGVLDGGSFTFNTISRYFWYVYPRLGTKISNVDVWVGYFYLYSTNFDSNVVNDTHYMENINIYSESVTRDIYMYQPSGDWKVEMLNVRAPLQTNGIVRVLRHSYYPLNDDFYFFFSVAIKVVDKDGVPIVGATVTMTDKDSNEVFDDTDANGDVLLKVKSYENLATAGDEYGTYTDFNPFVLIIEKAGLATYTEEGIDFYDKIEKTIALQIPSGEMVPETVIYSAELYDTIIY